MIFVQRRDKRSTQDAGAQTAQTAQPQGRIREVWKNRPRFVKRISLEASILQLAEEKGKKKINIKGQRAFGCRWDEA
jgi:hypothetical protein